MCDYERLKTLPLAHRIKAKIEIDNALDIIKNIIKILPPVAPQIMVLQDISGVFKNAIIE